MKDPLCNYMCRRAELSQNVQVGIQGGSQNLSRLVIGTLVASQDLYFTLQRRRPPAITAFHTYRKHHAACTPTNPPPVALGFSLEVTSPCFDPANADPVKSHKISLTPDTIAVS